MLNINYFKNLKGGVFMQINFNQLWKKDLGLIYKEVSIDRGKQFKVDIDLKEVKNIIVNYKVNDKSFTDSVEIIDIENNIMLSTGVNSV